MEIMLIEVKSANLFTRVNDITQKQYHTVVLFSTFRIAFAQWLSARAFIEFYERILRQ